MQATFILALSLAAVLYRPSGMLCLAQQPEDGRYLPPNTWVRLRTNPTHRFLPRGFTDCTQAGVRSHPAGRRASSIVYGGGILYWGGAGQSYPANDVELFDIASNTWMQQYHPECLPACCLSDQRCSPACLPIGGVGTTEITPLGRPYVEHAFQLIAYNPLRQRYTAALTSGLWEWSPSTKDWARLTSDIPESTDPATKMLAYDPNLGTVLYFATTRPNHTVFRFDYDTNTWVPHSPIPYEVTWSRIFSAYDPRERKHLISHGRGTMWIYDATDPAWKQLRDVPADPLLSTSLAYDPIAGVFLLAKRDDTGSVRLWSYRIHSDSWTALEAASSPPKGPTGDYNGLIYDQVWKRFYFVNVRAIGGGGRGGDAEGDVETWAYRIGGPAGPGDTNCDGRLTAADLLHLIKSLGSNPTAGCGAVDTDRDGVVANTDLSYTVGAIFSAPNYVGSTS